MKYSIWMKSKTLDGYWQELEFSNTKYIYDLDKCKKLVTQLREENPKSDLKIVQTFVMDVDF